MANFGKQMLNILGEIKGTGSFVSSGVQPFLFPGLQIRGMDEIGFPINATQIKALIKIAHQAPFGKGSKTVLDKAVRSAWEIDANQIKFVNKKWGEFVDGILKQIKPSMGLEGLSVSANLYKLLIYQKGDFFLPHKDSEKEPGMFGTLIIGLPSSHTGGELVVKFDGCSEVIDFSDPVNKYQIPFAAFYADCEHEIRPITSGYRVCLVYNLVQVKADRKIQPQQLNDQVKQLAELLKASEEDQDIPKIVLLGHQYTPSNFTMNALKLNDRHKAEALIRAAELAEFYIKPGLVTSYQVGELTEDDTKQSSSGRNYRKRNRYYEEYDDENLTGNGIIGEVYDEYVCIEHWMKGGIPPLRNIQFDEMDLISAITLNEGEPIEKAAEGYTGNAGMEMQYWYHYGAIFLWPRKYHYDMVIDLDTENKLEWIGYYNQHWETLTKGDVALTKKLVEAGMSVKHLKEKADYSPLADWLMNLNDEKYLLNKGSQFLTDHFVRIAVDKWIKLVKHYPIDQFENIFLTAGNKKEVSVIRHLLGIFNDLLENSSSSARAFVEQQASCIPGYLENLKLTAENEKKGVREILRYLLQIDGKKVIKEKNWHKKITAALTQKLTREYVNDILIVEILGADNKSNLAEQLLSVCISDLQRRVLDKPKPPISWSRPVPKKAGIYGDVWDILADFLKSATVQIFNYQAILEKRKEMEYAIGDVVIDIEMETIRRGSPHTLRLTKTQYAYERELAKWKEDVEILEKIK
ncbi:2OG-Fe(II) oxygenase [Chitinophaga sancti]|uniref:2OG-Fe(II) oxygenase n=1 Tax=Chitinophaga sancti TaxID=1004 RepID=UPI003F7A304F